MRLSRYHALGLAGLLLFLAAGSGRADTTPDPLRLVPDQADLFIEVRHPGKLVETVTSLKVVKQLQGLGAVQELFASADYRRFYQLVAYFERELGASWPVVLDRLAGGGAVLAVKLGPNPAPSLLVIQGKDKELLQKFAGLGLEVVEQEIARQEGKDRPVKGSYREVEFITIGKEFHAAVAGSALLISNSEVGLKHGIDLHLDGGKSSMAQVSGVAQARKLLPPTPLAAFWLNLENVRKAPQAKDVFTLPRNDVNLTVGFGGWLDVAGRAPFLCAGLYRQKDGFLTTVRMPRGRQGLNPALASHVPPAGQPGSRPLLEPKGILVSTSYYLDVAKFWEERTKLFNKQQVKALEEFDKNSGRFLAGNQVSKLLTQAGPYQRIVVAHQPTKGYKIEPRQAIPAFAFVVEMREPEAFSKSMDAVLRAAALLATTQVKLKLTEEKHGEHMIVGYRFPEDVPLKADINDIRFNFSPCFLRVGNQFVACSTLELAHEMVDLLEKEATAVNKKKGSPAAVRTQIYASGGVATLKTFEDQLLTQAILDRAIPLDEARKEVQAFIDILRQLGVVQIESRYRARDFNYDIRLKLNK